MHIFKCTRNVENINVLLSHALRDKKKGDVEDNLKRLKTLENSKQSKHCPVY